MRFQPAAWPGIHHVVNGPIILDAYLAYHGPVGSENQLSVNNEDPFIAPATAESIAAATDGNW